MIATIAALLLAVAAQASATLDDVVVTGSIETARALIARGADVNARDDQGVTPLMRAASSGRADMVRLLVASGAQVDVKTSGGVTPLMMASLAGYREAMMPLLERKADARAKDNEGRTALMAAASSGDRAAVEALLEAGAEMDAEDAAGNKAITYAAAEGHADAVDALQRRGAKDSDTELILAAGRCNTAIVGSFLRAGMNLNTPGMGTTPLIVAAGGNCAETVALLTQLGANLNLTNNDGWTALIKATAAGHTEVVRLLLDKGADMNVSDSLGRTAWMYAAMANREEIAGMFKRARGAQGPVATLEVTSPAMKAGETMSREFTADGHNVSPPLNWSNAPPSARSFAVVCEDPDAGNPPPFVHWVIYNIPANAKGLPENVPFEPSAPMPSAIAGAVQGLSGFRRPFYRGPAPPSGKPHHYHFVVYALDTSDLKPGLNRAELLEAIKGHIAGQGELVVTYERKP